MTNLLSLADLTEAHFPWARWERLIQTRGLEIDRPAGEPHPDFAKIIYPLDYGYVPETRATDGEPVDCFRGSRSDLGLVGLIITHDHRQEKREFNLLHGTTPAEAYCAHGFLSFAPRLLESVIVMRRPMHVLWREAGEAPAA